MTWNGLSVSTPLMLALARYGSSSRECEWSSSTKTLFKKNSLHFFSARSKMLSQIFIPSLGRMLAVYVPLSYERLFSYNIVVIGLSVSWGLGGR